MIRRLLAWTLWLGLLAALVGDSVAQPPQGRFEVYSTADGLPSHMVSALLQDRTGYLWIGTFGGLARYDGDSFKVFRHLAGDSESLPHDYVRLGALVEDGAGRLWVGTEGGVAVREPGSDSFRSYAHNPDDSTSLSSSIVSGLAAGPDGSVWVATASGLNRINPGDERVQRFAAPGFDADAVIMGVEVDSRGRLWVSTTEHLYQIDESGYLNRSISVEDLGLPPQEGLRALEAGDGGLIWVGTEQGRVLEIASETGRLARSYDVREFGRDELSNQVLSLRYEPGGILLVGTRAHGLKRLDTNSGHWQSFAGTGALSDLLVTSVLRDNRENLWVGTWGGLDKWTPDQSFRVLFSGTAETRNEPVRVTALAPGPEGTVWAGTVGEGLLQVKVDTRSTGLTALVTRRHSQASLSGAEGAVGRVTAVLPTEASGLWVTTGNGGVRHLPAFGPTGQLSTVFREPEWSAGYNDANRIIHTRSGELWVGLNRRGLLRRTPEGVMVHYTPTPDDSLSLPTGVVWTLLEDREGRMWVGTHGGGLVTYDPARDGFLRVPSSGGLGQGRILSIRERSNGQIWVGTMGDGAYVLEDSRVVAHYTTGDGLPSDDVACTLGDTIGNSWLATPSGLARLDKDSGDIAVFDQADGLPAAAFEAEACAALADGILLFGTEAGVLAFRPEGVSVKHEPPPVVISDVRVAGVSSLPPGLPRNPVMRLAYDENYLDFHFAALDFTRPEKNRFKYRLLGLDSTWEDPGTERTASFPRLTPGSYTFQVKAANASGVWSEGAAEASFRILPPFWLRWWFFLGAGASVAIGVAGFVGYHREQARKLHLTRQRIADDLHDELGSQLSGMALAMDIAADSGQPVPSSELASSAEEARDLLARLRDTVWLIDGSFTTVGQLVERVQQSADDLLPDAKVRVEVVGPSAKELEMGHRRHLLFLSKEILHNASRHADAGEMAIRVEVGAKYLAMSFRDDGRGFNPESGDGRGLSAMRRRIQSLGGHISLSSTPGRGTEVEVSVPLK